MNNLAKVLSKYSELHLLPTGDNFSSTTLQRRSFHFRKKWLFWFNKSKLRNSPPQHESSCLQLPGRATAAPDRCSCGARGFTNG